MDRGGLDGLSFERGGRSADYVPASPCFFCWSLSASALACFRSCFDSVGLRCVGADSLLCFEVATLRARRAVFACFLLFASVASLGSAIHSSSIRCDRRVFASLQSAHGLRLLGSSRCSPVLRLSPALRLPPWLRSSPWLGSLARLLGLVCLRSPRLLGSAGVSLALLSTVRRG